MRPLLAPLFEIAKGMKRARFASKLSWQALHQLAPGELSKRLQGSLSREELVAKLTFNPTIPAEKQLWLKRWIAKAGDDQLKQFLYTLTGSSAIGTMEIEINDNSRSATAPIYFHTCSNLVDIPFAKFATEEEFVPHFVATLGGTKRFNRA
jgi:hypothetical protein